LRFSHVPKPGEREQAGRLGGVWIVGERLGNVPPQGLVQSTQRDDVSLRLPAADGSQLDSGTAALALVARRIFSAPSAFEVRPSP
jgi:hypothetical protein